MKVCVIHHYACDCREDRVYQLIDCLIWLAEYNKLNEKQINPEALLKICNDFMQDMYAKI